MKKISDALFYAGVYVHVVFNQFIGRVADWFRNLNGR